MFIQRQSTTKHVEASMPVTERRIRYTRWQGANRILSGTIREEREVAVKRWPGVVVTEYRVKPDAGQTNLSEHWVNESDVIEITVNPVCPRCNGVGHIAIQNGDDAIDCPECGFSDEWKVF